MFVAGNIAKGPNGILQGRLGENMEIEQAYEGAKLAALNLLATLKAELGDLDRVKKILKLLCFVNAVPGFVGLPKVSNGASDLLVALYGENGKHARSTVGVASVGGGACIEIEMVVEVE
jgi:enamine deaminase RidA (YjgF/YER057c/UK114 family)